MTRINTGAIDRREAAIASALAGAVVVVLGYASGLGVSAPSQTMAAIEPAAPVPGSVAPAPQQPSAPAMTMPMGQGQVGVPSMSSMAMPSQAHAGASGGHGSGATHDGAGGTTAPTGAHPAQQCRAVLAALPTSDLPLAGTLTGSLTGSVTNTVDGLLDALLGGSSTVGGLAAPVTDPVTGILTTPLAGGDGSGSRACLPGSTSARPERAR